MRRSHSTWIIVSACCVAFSFGESAVLGHDDNRTSMFRVLTSEQPALPPASGPVARAASEPPGPSITRTAEALPEMIAPQRSPSAPTYVRSPIAAPTARPASFYGGNSARQTLSQLPRRAAIQTNPQRIARRQPKPFENTEHEPTISPYLNLDRDDNDTQEVPNYLTMVVPQLEQMQTNRLQQREIQKLRGQLQTMSGNGIAAPGYDMSRSPGMGSPARFMDTAQFYSGLRK